MSQVIVERFVLKKTRFLQINILLQIMKDVLLEKFKIPKN